MTQQTEDQAGIQTLAVWQRPLRGPVTRRRLRRFLTGAAVVAAAVVALALGAGDGSARGFALGLLLPGGGFAYGIDNPWLAAVLAGMTVLALALALAMWAAVGNILAPPSVILGSAAISAVATDVQVRPGALPAELAVFGALVLAGMLYEARRRRAVSRGKRWLLDLALQPPDQFTGLDQRDRFSFAALRHQLNFTQYALAMAQRHHTPSFHGYLSAAQRNLIDKMLDPQVWGYWRLENLWGQPRSKPGPDPAGHHHVLRILTPQGPPAPSPCTS